MSEKFDKDKVSEPETIKKSGTYPVMPLRNTVLFPQQVIPIYIGRERSLKLIEELDPKKMVLLKNLNLQIYMHMVLWQSY